MNAFESPMYVTRPFFPPLESFVGGVRGIWEAGRLTNDGPLLTRLEKELKCHLATDNLAVFSNGTQALEIAVRALGLSGEVITTPFTFVATTNALVANGLTPVFCDVDPVTYNLDPGRVEELITDRTAAILGVHVFGHPCDLDALKAIAARRDLRLIYDAAHAFGVKVGGRQLCTHGDVSMVSFHATKLFHTVEGGMLVFADAGAEERARLMRNFGFTSREEIDVLGTNAKMSEMHALMGLTVLPYLDTLIEKRRRIVAAYREALGFVEGLRFGPESPSDVEHNYSYMTVEVEEEAFGMSRDSLLARLADYNVFARRYFCPVIQDHPYYRRRAFDIDTPVARALAGRILALPCYHDLGLRDVRRICAIIREIQETSKRVRAVVARAGGAGEAVWENRARRPAI